LHSAKFNPKYPGGTFKLVLKFNSLFIFINISLLYPTEEINNKSDEESNNKRKIQEEVTVRKKYRKCISILSISALHY